MELNGITLIGYFEDAGRRCFEIVGSLSDAASLDGKALEVTDRGEEVESFPACEVKELSLTDDGHIRVWTVAGMDVEKEIAGLKKSVTEVAAKAGAAASAAETAERAVSAVSAACTVYVSTATDLTDAAISQVAGIIPDFKPGAEYERGMVRRHGGKYYRMAKDIDAATSKTYLPGPGTESLYTLIDLAPDGIRVWHAPTCAEDSFALDERAHYPDADGPVYISGRDGNVSVPGSDEWWVLEGGGE